MALTSVAGATLTKLQAGGAGFPVPVSFTSQSYSGWIKIPSIGVERTLFDHDGRLAIKIDSAGKIALWLDGLLAATGTVVVPINKWINWVFKRNASPSVNHVVTISWVDCVDNVPTLTTQTQEINHTQSIAAGSPTQFTLYIPAGCVVSQFIYGNSTTNLTSARNSWNTTLSSNAIWRCPLRFPNDLNDHREISASSGDVSFHGMHEWETIVGTIILDSGKDPEHLLDKICSAVVAYRSYSPHKQITHAPLGLGEVASTFVDFQITFLTDVLPSTAVLSRITAGAYAYQSANGGSDPFAIPDTPSKWKFGADPTEYGPNAFAGDQYGYFDWSHFGTPNPNVNNPSTGLPWTLSDLYNATVLNGCEWGPGGFAGQSCAVHNTIDANIAVLYYGQTTPGTCGDALPPVETGTIVVIKETPGVDDGTEFPFIVNLDPGSFNLQNGESIQYNDVPTGSGYSVVETVPSGWQVSYNVSNGSSNTNISVGVGETVIVTVTDIRLPNRASGIYKIVPNKRQDTLWNENFIGTTDVKIP